MPHLDNSILGFTNIALDAAFAKVAGGMLAQIFAITNNPSSAMQLALAKLDAEIDRLNAAELPLLPDNAVLEQTLRVYEEAL